MKTFTLSRSLILAVLSCAVMGRAYAAPTTVGKTPVTPKAPVKNTAKQPKLIREVLGTEQLVGYEGDLGETFTLGKQVPLNFTLKSAEYSVGRVNIGGTAHFPKGDEKLLVLHFTVQNPQHKVRNLSSSDLAFKAVDANGVTRDFVGDLAHEVTGEPLRLALNPGQKVEGYTAIRVAAFGPVPKLIVQNWYERQAPIVRYDLRGKVAPLATPYGDASGVSAARLVTVKAGEFYPVTDLFDARLDSVAYLTTPVKSVEAGKGKRYCTAIFTLKNKALSPQRFSYSYFRADLKDADGDKTDYNTSMLKASRDEEANGELAPGEETRVRFYWALPDTLAAKSVLLQYGYDRESRTYAFEVPQQ